MTIEVSIVSRFDDSHVLPVTRHIEKAWDASVSWLPLGLSSDKYTVQGGAETATIGIVGWPRGVTLVNRPVVYLPFAVDVPDHVDAEGEFARREWNAVVEGILAVAEYRSNVDWLVSPGAEILQDRKVFLLTVARDVCQHIVVPPVLIGKQSRSFDEALGKDVVAKAINMWQEIRSNEHFNTTRLSKDFVSQMNSEGASYPVMLQDFVDHEDEFRIYFVHGSIEAVLLNRGTSAEVDFRLIKESGSSAALVPSSELDDGLLADVRRLSEALELRYFAIDVGVAEGAAVLFDINPIGSWRYLERSYGIDVTSGIIDSYMKAVL